MTVLHQGEGPIRNIKWGGKFIAWANNNVRYPLRAFYIFNQKWSLINRSTYMHLEFSIITSLGASYESKLRLLKILSNLTITKILNLYLILEFI